MDFGLFTSGGEACGPERFDRLFPLCRERGEVAAFEAAKVERYAMKGKAMLLAETPSELAGARRTGERAGGDEAGGKGAPGAGPPAESG
jgi:hypothetical protein